MKSDWLIYRVMVYRLDGTPFWPCPSEYSSFTSALAVTQLYRVEGGFRVVYLGSRPAGCAGDEAARSAVCAGASA